MTASKETIAAFIMLMELNHDFAALEFKVMNVVRAYLWQAATGCESKKMTRGGFLAEAAAAWDEVQERHAARAKGGPR